MGYHNKKPSLTLIIKSFLKIDIIFRLARAEKEREEMIEAKKREIEKELDDLEEEDSYTDDDDMDGSPTFLEPLQDTLFKEGEKFQLSCSIAGFPQPKVSQKKIP